MSSHQCGKPGPLTNHFIIDRYDIYMYPVVSALRCNKVQYIIWKWSIMLIHELSSGERERKERVWSCLTCAGWHIQKGTYRLATYIDDKHRETKHGGDGGNKSSRDYFQKFLLIYFFTSTLTIYSKITISNVIIMQKILSFNHIVLGMWENTLW